MKVLGYALIALFAVWAVCAALGVMGQRKLFYQEGSEELYDYWMPRMCLEQGYVGHPERYQGLVDAKKCEPIIIDDIDVLWSDWYTDGEKTFFITGWRDRVYPLFGILPLKPFPATRFGGYLWSGVAGLVFLASLCLISKSWWPLLLACSMPFLFNIERGNTTWLSAAFAGVFLAWWDDEKYWKQLAAAVCLAVAGGLKVTPFALGLIYFTKWRWRPVLLCGFLSAVFVFVPWMFMSDGLAEFSAMIRNAAAQSQFMQRGSDIGLVQLWRTVRIVLGQDVHEVWPGMKLVAVTSQLIGAAVLVVGAKRRDYLLMVGGMLWAAGNMYYYAMLYLLPVLVIELFSRKDRKDLNHEIHGIHEKSRPHRDPLSSVLRRLSFLLPMTNFSRVGRVDDKKGLLIWIELGLWLALLCPVQLVLLGHSANQVIGNVALMGLMGIRLVCGGNCFAATAFAEATVVKKSAKSAKI